MERNLLAHSAVVVMYTNIKAVFTDHVNDFHSSMRFVEASHLCILNPEGNQENFSKDQWHKKVFFELFIYFSRCVHVEIEQRLYMLTAMFLAVFMNVFYFYCWYVPLIRQVYVFIMWYWCIYYHLKFLTIFVQSF